MKTSYIIRAKKFLKQIYPYIKDYLEDEFYIRSQVEKYCEKHSNRYINISSGSARIALITSDYVIKWEYDTESVDEIGGNNSEVEMYEIAKKEGYEYLLAEPTPVTIDEKNFLIMPKILHTGPWYGKTYKNDLSTYLTADESTWLNNKIQDLHLYNWGFKNNHPVIVDYAMNEYFEPKYYTNANYKLTHS